MKKTRSSEESHESEDILLQLKNISYKYEKTPLLVDLNLHLADDEILCLLGESGSGKSTLLRIIAGLEKPDSGDVIWNGSSILRVPSYKRNFGLMFQDYALFPHRSVFENIAFGLKMNKVEKEKSDEIVRQLLVQVGMETFGDRNVTELSGGEQQRVALARALAPKPHLLMLDEPLGALDHALRLSLITELRHILGENGIPSIYVTHDQDEAFSIADRVSLLHDGQIIQNDTPEMIYAAPKSVWAARFLGLNNILPAIAVGEPQVTVRIGSVVHTMTVPTDYPLINGQKIWILFKDAEINEPTLEDYKIQAMVESCIFKGDYYEIQARITPDVLFSVKSVSLIEVGTNITLSYKTENLLVIFV